MLIELLKKRRSIRKFQDRPVEKEKIDMLVEAALCAPSSRNTQPWEFVVVTDPETLAGLSKAKPKGASFIENAKLAIVVCADPQKTDVWVEDAAVSSVIIQLAAADLGLGSCWSQMRMRNHDEEKSAGEYISELLNLPERLNVATVVAI
ncbi:MAG: nitroreductase family protein, partial [Desulfobacteraceae bacterium]|nr:nitroreductase family protein [Desulfobacteraceae bacterium]